MGARCAPDQSIVGHHRKQKLAGVIAGERHPGTVGAVQARGQADDEQARLVWAPGRDRRAMIAGIEFAIFEPIGPQSNTAPTIRIKRRWR